MSKITRHCLKGKIGNDRPPLDMFVLYSIFVSLISPYNTEDKVERLVVGMEFGCLHCFKFTEAVFNLNLQ